MFSFDGPCYVLKGTVVGKSVVGCISPGGACKKGHVLVVVQLVRQVRLECMVCSVWLVWLV